MAALTQSRGERTTTYKTVALPMNSGSGMKATTGGLACVDTNTHYVVPGAASTTLIPIGLFQETVDNTSGTGAVNVLVKLFKEVEVTWFDSVTGGNAVSTTVGGGSFFTTVYIADDHTVTTSSSGASIAGRVWDCNSTQGVAVQNVQPSDNLLT